MVVNGIKYDIQVGYQTRDTLTNELASKIVITYTKEKDVFNEFDLVLFEDKQWFISTIRSSREGDEYQNSLTLVELSYILEKFILPPCSFTNANDWLWQQMEKAFYKTEILRIGETTRFKLTDELKAKTFLMGEEWFFDKQSTLREVLDAMLSLVKCRAYVEYVSPNWNEIIIGVLDLSKQSEEIKTIESIDTEQFIKNTLHLASDYETKVSNVLTIKDPDNIYKLAYEEWQTVKPISMGIANTSNVIIATTHRIDKLYQVVCKFYSTYDTLEDGTSKQYKYLQNIDITNLFVDKQIYDTMPIEVQEEHIPYNRSDRNLGVLESVRVMFFTRDKLKTYLDPIANQRLVEYLNRNGIEYNRIISTPEINKIYEEMLFLVIYYPYIDLYYKQGKENVRLPARLTSIQNQTESEVDKNRQGILMRSLVNRVGNAELESTGTVYSKNDLLELGDRIAGDYTLIARECSVWNGSIDFVYLFVKNYDVVLTSKLSRERRFYSIPLIGVVERDLLVKDRLILSTEDLGQSNGIMRDTAINVILKSFDKSAPDDPVDRLLFNPLNDFKENILTNSSYSLAFSPNALGNNIVWSTIFEDNYSVGLSLAERFWVGGKRVHMNPYVDEKGEMYAIDINLINSAMSESFSDNELFDVGYNLPLLPVDYLNGEKTNYIKVNYTPLNHKLIIYKDSFEKINFSYQLGVEAHKVGEIIIGEYFTKDNSIAFGRNVNDYYIWVSQTETYRLTDTIRCKGTRTVSKPIVENRTIYTDYSMLHHMESWAVGNYDGSELVFAVNNRKLIKNKVYFTTKR